MSVSQSTTRTSSDFPGGTPRAWFRWFGGLAATALAGTWMLAGSVPAHAATGVALVGQGGLMVQAAAGKANNLTITASAGEAPNISVVIEDTGDTVLAGAGCSQVNENTVTCMVRITAPMWIESGDLDDTVILSGGMVRTTVKSRDGDDHLIGSDQTDILDGGRGNDLIEGRGHRDIIGGASGDDLLYGNDGDDDIYGEEGNDTIYAGNGTDVIWAFEGDDYLNGEGGEDSLYGGPGADTIAGGAGNDSAFGDEGNDTVTVVDQVPFNDTADGGPGQDQCAADTGDTATTCETVTDM
jgi:Ca2+-binding RTX toxin-like protein